MRLDGASDHGVSEALYLRDPDENGVELYWDRPEGEWPRTADGRLAMVTELLDLDGLRGEGCGRPWWLCAVAGVDGHGVRPCPKRRGCGAW